MFIISRCERKSLQVTQAFSSSAVWLRMPSVGDGIATTWRRGAWPSSDFCEKHKPFFQQQINPGAHLSSFALLRVARNLGVPIHTPHLQGSVKCKLTTLLLTVFKIFWHNIQRFYIQEHLKLHNLETLTYLKFKVLSFSFLMYKLWYFKNAFYICSRRLHWTVLSEDFC